MFVGRESQIELLSSVWTKDSPSLVVVSGRRRIGKSTLVEEFAKRSRCRFLEIEGLPPDENMTNEQQLANFCDRLAKVAGTNVPVAQSWPAAFDALERCIGRKGN